MSSGNMIDNSVNYYCVAFWGNLILGTLVEFLNLFMTENGFDLKFVLQILLHAKLLSQRNLPKRL